MNATARGSSTELVHHAKRAAWYALVTMILTSVHHAYGAFVYATPWRLHVVAVSAVIAPLVFIALAALRKNAWNRTPGAFAFWSFFLVTFIFPVAGIGVFEGAYNHVVKNVLYFGGAPVSLLHALFPPGIYELPDNAIFELTGVVQTVPALMAGWELVQLLRARTSQ